MLQGGKKIFRDQINLESSGLNSRLTIGPNLPRTFPVCVCCLCVIINKFPLALRIGLVWMISYRSLYF